MIIKRDFLYSPTTQNRPLHIWLPDDYYETDEYVLTHGWVPIILEDRTPIIVPDWRDASSIEWGEARWLPWQQLYETNAKLEGKTIVCGHRPARMGVMFDQSREPDDSSIFYGEGMIAIDAGTVVSGRVNVLVIKEDLKKNDRGFVGEY